MTDGGGPDQTSTARIGAVLGSDRVPLAALLVAERTVAPEVQPDVWPQRQKQVTLCFPRLGAETIKSYR